MVREPFVLPFLIACRHQVVGNIAKATLSYGTQSHANPQLPDIGPLSLNRSLPLALRFAMRAEDTVKSVSCVV